MAFTVTAVRNFETIVLGTCERLGEAGILAGKENANVYRNGLTFVAVVISGIVVPRATEGLDGFAAFGY